MKKKVDCHVMLKLPFNRLSHKPMEYVSLRNFRPRMVDIPYPLCIDKI